MIESQAAKRGALVEAAYREIAERGFEGLRTREVASAVGVNIATLHYYFPSKEDLIKGVVGHAMSRFRSTMSGEGTAADQLRAHFAGLRRLSRGEPELFKVMGELTLRAARDTGLAEVVRKTNEYWHQTLRGLLRDARAAGDLGSGIDPDGMTAVIVATLKGVYLLPGSDAPETFEKTLKQLEKLLALRKTRGARRKGSTKR